MYSTKDLQQVTTGLQKSPGDSDGNVLHMVEVESGALPCVLQWLSGESLVMAVHKTERKMYDVSVNENNSYLNCVKMSVYSDANP